MGLKQGLIFVVYLAYLIIQEANNFFYFLLINFWTITRIRCANL